MAQAYGVAAINRLAMMAGLAVDALGQPIKRAESEATQARRELLDRGHGKPTQPVEADSDRPSTVVFHWAKAGDVVDHEPVTTLTEVTAPPLETVPANANDTDEAPRFVLRFAGD
jgi:hypothetical protein